MLIAKVKERHTRGVSEVANGIAYLVVQRVHKVTFLYRKNLVKSASNMETDGTLLLLELLFAKLCKFLARAPFLV